MTVSTLPSLNGSIDKEEATTHDDRSLEEKAMKYDEKRLEEDAQLTPATTTDDGPNPEVRLSDHRLILTLICLWVCSLPLRMLLSYRIQTRLTLYLAWCTYNLFG